MRQIVLGLLAAAILYCAPAQADSLVVAVCGTLPLAYAPGAVRNDTVDVNGVKCTSAGGGGGGLSVTDRAAWTQAVSPFTPSGCVYNDAATLTSGLQGTFRCNSARGLIVGTDAANPLAVSAVGVAQGSTTSGQTGSLVMGAVTTAAPSYTTGQTSPESLTTAGAKRSDISSVNGNTALAGNGATGTGSPRVTLSNDNTIPTGWPTAANQTAWQSATGAAPPVNSAYLGVNGSGATGGFLRGVIGCDASAIYDASTNGSTELVALTSGRTVYICGYSVIAGGTVNVKLITGTGTACATGSANITPAYQLTAQVGIADGAPFYRGLKGASASAGCINTSAGVAAQAIIYYSII